MNLLEHVMIAVDAIRANPVRAFLTTLGVLIGVLRTYAKNAATVNSRGSNN